MENYENVRPFEEVHGTAKNKWNELKANAKLKAGQAVNWFHNNRDEIVTISGAVVAAAGVAGSLIRAVNNSSWGTKRQREASTLKKYCYDRSAGHYWELRRPLSNQEWAAVEDRRRRGERIGDILEDMRVLK